MEAKWTFTKLVGCACCLVALAAVSFHGVEGTQAAEEQTVQNADSLSKVGAKAQGKLIDKDAGSLSETLMRPAQTPDIRQKSGAMTLEEALAIKQKNLLAKKRAAAWFDRWPWLEAILFWTATGYWPVRSNSSSWLDSRIRKSLFSRARRI